MGSRGPAGVNFARLGIVSPNEPICKGVAFGWQCPGRSCGSKASCRPKRPETRGFYSRLVSAEHLSDKAD